MKDYLKAVNRKLKSNLTKDDFFSVEVTGKRSEIEESGNRYYGDWGKIYNILKENFKQGNITEVSIEQSDDYGEYPNIFSESEYYGVRMKYPVIKIKTPKTNKIKAVIDGRYI